MPALVERGIDWLPWLVMLGVGWIVAFESMGGNGGQALSLLVSLALVAVAQWRLGGRRQFNRAAALAALCLASVVLVRESFGLGGPGGMEQGTAGVSVFGGAFLGGWLVAVSLGTWCLTSRRQGMMVLGLTATALACIMVTAASVFLVGCRLVLGTLPDNAVLASPAWMLMVVLLTFSTVLSAWAQVDRHAREAPEGAYRWMFARNLAVLLTTTFLAGLSTAVLGGAQAVGLLTDGLHKRAIRQARAVEQLAEQHLHLVRALSQVQTPQERQVLLKALGEDADELVFSDTRPAAAIGTWPVLGGIDHAVELLSNGAFIIELRSGPTALFVTLHHAGMKRLAAQLKGRVSDEATTRSLFCKPTGPSQFECLQLKWIDGASAGSESPFRFSTFEHADGERHLQNLLDEHGDKSLGLFAAVGDRDSVLLLKMDEELVLAAIGRPLLLAVSLLSLLAMLVAGWSWWRQLPQMRALHHARAQGEAMLAQLPLPVIVLDTSHQIVQANEAARRLLRWEGSDLPGQPVTKVLEGGLPNGEQMDGRPVLRQCVARGFLGESIPVEVRRSSFKVMGEDFTQVILRDLRDERRQANELLRWRNVFDDPGLGMFLSSAGAEPLLELVNPALARMLGYEAWELAGTPVHKLIAPTAWTRFVRLAERVASGESAQGTLSHVRRDGVEVPTWISMSGVRDVDRTLTHVLCSVQDISPLKRAEDAATQNAIHLRAVLDALPASVWIGDVNGRVLQVNRTAHRFWPVGADGLPRGSDQVSLMRRAAITRREQSGEIVEQDMPSGESRSLLTLASPMIDPATDQVIGAIAIDEDITRLRQGEQEMRRAHDLLERILQSSAVAIALTDGNGVVLRHNPAWALLVGSAPHEALLEFLLEPDDDLRQRALLQRVGSGELPTFVGEHRVQRLDGTFKWALLLVSRLDGHSEQGPKVLVQLLDIEDRRRAGEEITASNVRLAVAQKLARVGDWQWRISDGMFSCSDEMLSLLGYVRVPRGRLTRDQLLGLVHETDRQRLSTALDNALLNFGQLNEDVQLADVGRGPRVVHFQGVTHRTSEGLTMAGTLQDVSDRKLIEQELRESRERLRELMVHEDQILEAERKRIAREVHDELGQLLTALRMDLSFLRADFTPESPAAQRAARMRETMATMTDVVRHVASNLRPAALDLGLVAAIEWLAEDFSLRWETAVDLQLPREHEPVLPEVTALALFRAVQESLTNIAKHAGASEVQVLLKEAEGGLLLRVTDNGQGFDPVAVAVQRGGGLGLLGMKERMHAIGAMLHIQSGKGGTVVEIRCALPSRTPLTSET